MWDLPRLTIGIILYDLLCIIVWFSIGLYDLVTIGIAMWFTMYSKPSQWYSDYTILLV